MTFQFSSLSLIRSRNRKKPAFWMAREVRNSYLLTTRDANCPYGRRLGGTGGVLVAVGQVPEQRRRLQWLRRPLINLIYQAIDGTILTASLCRFTIFLRNTGVSDE